MSYIVILLCSLLSLMTAVAPFFGWSYYSLEGSMTSCAVEWAERSTNVISYNIFIFMISFCIPIGIIIPSNLKLLMIVIIFQFILFEILTFNLKFKAQLVFESLLKW